MTWHRSNDLDYDDPLVRAVGNAAYGAFHRMELYASAQRTDGWIPTDKAQEIASRAELRALLTTRIEGATWGPMLHGPGDACRCLDGMAGRAERGGFWLHDFLQLNPSRAENDVHRAKKRELRDPKLKLAVRQRDQDRCRYCGKHCKFSDRVSDDGLTFDHPDPEIADGMNNLVVACRGCNGRKQRRTPEQAGMELLPVPLTSDLPTTGPVTRPVTVAGPDAGPVTGPDTGPSGGLPADLQQDTARAQVPNSPGRDGAGSAAGGRRPRVGPPGTRRAPGNGSPYLRQRTPPAGHPPPTEGT